MPCPIARAHLGKKRPLVESVASQAGGVLSPCPFIIRLPEFTKSFATMAEVLLGDRLPPSSNSLCDSALSGYSAVVPEYPDGNVRADAEPSSCRRNQNHVRVPERLACQIRVASDEIRFAIKWSETSSHDQGAITEVRLRQALACSW